MMREVMSIVLDCWLGPNDSELAEASKDQGVAYNELVKEKGRGRGVGSPHVWTFGGFLKALVQKCEKAIGQEVREETKTLKAFLEEFETMTLQSKSEEIRFYKLAKTRKQETVRVTLAMGKGTDKVREALLTCIEICDISI